MIKACVVLGAFVSLNALAGNSDFDAYMNSNAKSRALTSKAKNQEAFGATQPYRASQDPQVQAASGSGPTFKMGGSNTSGSFSGGSGSSGAGAFKPTAVTTKPVTIKPVAASAPQAVSPNQQQPYFGTVGVNPTITNSTTNPSSASTANPGCTREMYGKSNCTYSPTAAGGPNAYGGAVGGYVNAANQRAGQIYSATGGRTPAQQAADQAAALQQQQTQQIQQNIIQNTVQQVQITIPR